MFGEVLTAMVTPFRKESREVDFPCAVKLARYLLSHGSDGLVVAGTTGEAPTLSDEEKGELFATVKKAVPSRPLLAGVGTNNTEHTLKLVELAEKAKVDGLLVVTPYYNKPPQEALLAHFSVVAKSTKLPIMLYDIPSRTGCALSLELLRKLKEIRNIVAIKDAAKDFDKSTQLLASPGKKLVLYSGNDSDTLYLLALGAEGVVSVASHLVGREIKSLIRHFKRGEIEKARKKHWQLAPLFSALFLTTNPIPVKYALSQLKLVEPAVRLPLAEASGSVRAKLRAQFKP